MLVEKQDFESLPSDMTDRFYTLVEQLGTSDQPSIVLLDFKSFAWVAKERTAYTGLTRKYLEAITVLTPGQARHCQAIIITGLTDPEWIAFVIRPYFRDLGSLENLTKNKHILYGTTDASLAALNPLPPGLSHTVMPKSDLPGMLNSFAEKAADPTASL